MSSRMIYLPLLKGSQFLVDGSGITAAPDGPQTTTNSQGVYTLEKYFNRYTYNYIYESRLPDGKCYRCGRKNSMKNKWLKLALKWDVNDEAVKNQRKSKVDAGREILRWKE